jgi:hypothetical protein
VSDRQIVLALANKPLTPGERDMLQRLAADEMAELEYAKGGGWWIGLDQVSGRVAWSLIRMSLVSVESNFAPSDIERWHINSMGRARLAGKPAESALAKED